MKTKISMQFTLLLVMMSLILFAIFFIVQSKNNTLSKGQAEVGTSDELYKRPEFPVKMWGDDYPDTPAAIRNSLSFS